MRHKGQHPIPMTLDQWSNRHPVASDIRDGTHWLHAWLAQKTTPYARLSKLTGIPSQRFDAIRQGDVVSRAEIDALARAWGVSANDLIKSIDGRSTIIE
jgi:hypothetical protein